MRESRAIPATPQSQAPHSRQQGASPFLWLLLITIPLFLLLAGVATHYALKKIETGAMAETRRNLEAVLHITHSAIEVWMEEKKNYVESFAQDPRLLPLIKQQLAIAHDRDHLLKSEQLQQLRLMYKGKDSLSGFGFMVIAPDHINLATKYDANIGAHNLIAEQRPELLSRVFNGETLVIPPVKGEIPIQRPDGTLIPIGYPTLFIATPIKDEHGQIIAAFAIRIDPAQSFARLTHVGSHDLKMNSYAFDGNGHPYILDNGDKRLDANQAKVTAQHIKGLIGTATADAITAVTDMNGYLNPQGVHVFGALLWDARYSLGLASEIDTATAMQGYQHARDNILILLATTTLIATLALLITALLMRHNHRLLERRVQERTAELTQANEALHTAKERVEGILAAIPDAIIQVDEGGLITAVNPRAEELLGYSQQALIGMEIEKLVPERLREKHLSARQQMMTPRAGTIKTSRPLIVVDKDGREIDVEINVNAFKIGEQWLAVAGLRDIRDRLNSEREQERLQQQLAQASKMKTIGQLTGGIAHDFNNILTSIMGFTELAITLTPADNQTLAHYLESIQQSSLRASELVKQMLAFSRGDSGQLQALLPAPIIKEAVNLLRATLPASIQINLNLAAGDSRITSDPTQLHQLIMNLVINARDALSGQGRIEIGLVRSQPHSTCNSCHEHISGKFIEIYVQDDGPGVAAENLDRIFDPFFSTKAVGKGTGLGLSIVHGIMHASAGHILVESHPGAGTRMRLLFPDMGQHQTESVADAATAPLRDNGSHHILIVDDEESITRFMSELFKGWGYRISSYNSAIEALAAVTDRPQEYDLIITDQTMPQMLGTELVRALLALRPDLPVILYSGHNDAVNEKNYQSYGLRAFLHKPVNTSTLHQTIQQLLT